jgi:hypothetical protein
LLSCLILVFERGCYAAIEEPTGKAGGINQDLFSAH